MWLQCHAYFAWPYYASSLTTCIADPFFHYQVKVNCCLSLNIAVVFVRPWPTAKSSQKFCLSLTFCYNVIIIIFLGNIMIQYVYNEYIYIYTYTHTYIHTHVRMTCEERISSHTRDENHSISWLLLLLLIMVMGWKILSSQIFSSVRTVFKRSRLSTNRKKQTGTGSSSSKRVRYSLV